MRIPPTDPDTLFEEFVQELPVEHQQMARDFKAFTRPHKVKNVTQLLRLVFLYCGIDLSLREVAGNFTLLYQRITDEGVRNRLRICGPWLRAMLTHLLGAAALQHLPPGFRFLVFDGSAIQGPGAKGTDYRLHIGMELVTLTFTHLLVTDKHTGESLAQFGLLPGDVALLDRGFCYHAPLWDAVNSGAEVTVRLRTTGIILCNEQRAPFDLYEELKKNEAKRIHSFEAYLAGTQREGLLKGWIHAYRLPEEKANEARRKLRRQQKKGKTPTAKTLYFYGWVIVFTTLHPDLLDAETILALYRVRWQIEIAIKRWKSLLDVGKLRAQAGSDLAEVWLLGKLLYALLLEKKTRRTVGDVWGWLDQERKATWWRPWKLLKAKYDPLITGSWYWSEDHWAEALEVLCERPRKRKLQQLPARVIELQKNIAALLLQRLRKVA